MKQFLRNKMRICVITAALFLCARTNTNAQPGTVSSWNKISATQGNLNIPFTNATYLGRGIANIGDINNDGVTDLAAGTYSTATGDGVVNILFMNSNGTVNSVSQIGENLGGLNGNFPYSMLEFGMAIAGLGDLNNDGIEDIVVGNGGGSVNGRGEIYILFLTSSGTVSSYNLITEGTGFIGGLTTNDSFGSSVANIGDINNDGVLEIAVGEPADDDGGPNNRGAIWIFSLSNSGSILNQQKISQTQGGFTGTLSTSSYLGSSVTGIGDLNGDSVKDIVVGSWGDSDGGTASGSIWVMFLDSSGSVQSHQEINELYGGFPDTLNNLARFGISLTTLGDINGDGLNEIAVGARGQDDGGNERGAVWVLSLNTNGTVASSQRISSTAGNFTASLDDSDNFGQSVAGIGDFNGDSIYDLCVGTERDDDGFTDGGALYLLYLNGTPATGITAPAAQSFTIYPNPANSIVHIKLTNESLNIKEVILTDHLGREVIKKRLTSASEQSLDLTGIAPGMYLLSLQQEDGYSRQKLIVY